MASIIGHLRAQLLEAAHTKADRPDLDARSRHKWPAPSSPRVAGPLAAVASRRPRGANRLDRRPYGAPCKRVHRSRAGVAGGAFDGGKTGPECARQRALLPQWRRQFASKGSLFGREAVVRARCPAAFVDVRLVPIIPWAGFCRSRCPPSCRAPNQPRCTCNPGGCRHFFARRIGLTSNATKR